MKKESNHKKYIKLLWKGFFSFLLIIIFLFIAISKGWLGYMPSFEELENPKNFLASEVYSADQRLLGTYYIENRSNVDYNELSPHLVNALISTEDIRFYNHSGIDGKALARVIFGIITLNPKGGGSTITQQLAKLFFHEPAKNIFSRALQKLNEWVIAVKFERRYTKEEILTMYLNRFDFLNQAVGIKFASKVYFNTSPDSLTIEQAATLVGMMQNPALYNPLVQPDTVRYRRNIVLHQMKKYGYLSKEMYDSLKALPLRLNYQKVSHKEGIATYFREYLRVYLTEWCKNHTKPDGEPYNLYTDGLKIYTTIDYKMQKYAEEAVREHISQLQKEFFKHWKGRNPWRDKYGREIKNFIEGAAKKSPRYKVLVEKYGKHNDSINIIMNAPIPMKIFTWRGDSAVLMSPMDSIRYYKHFLHCGFMSVDPHTGYVKAYVGGINYNLFQHDHVILGRRQVGSTFKPILYVLAMQSKQFSPCTKIPNIPVTFELPDGKQWTPKNSAKTKYDGQMVSLKWALANSVNWVSAYLMKQFSPQALIKVARSLGINSPMDAVPSLCLGTCDVSVYEMVGANATFANKGVYIKPMFITRIEDKYGNVIEEFQPETHEAIDEETAYLMLNLMQGVTEFGTGVRLRYRYKIETPVAGKTGTTQNQSDGWFIGLTPDLVTGVWVGCEDRSVHFRSVELGQGANMALPIWALYMKKIYADPTLKISKGEFEKPEQPLNVEIDCKKFEEQKKLFKM